MTVSLLEVYSLAATMYGIYLTYKFLSLAGRIRNIQNTNKETVRILTEVAKPFHKPTPINQFISSNRLN